MTFRRWLTSSLAILPFVLAGGPAPAQPLSLREAVLLAEKNSPLAIVAAERVREAAARTRQAEAMFYPNLKVTSSYSRSNNPVQVFMYALNQGEFALSPDLNDPAAADNWTVSGQAGLRLFNGGRDWANRRAAKSAQIGMEKARQVTLDELRLQVMRSYLQIITAAEFVRSAEASVKAYEGNEQVLTSRVSAGTALKTELLNIQVQKARAEERLLSARNGLSLANESLRLVMGLDSLPFTRFDSLDQISIPMPSQAQTGERPDVGARRAFADAARAQWRAAKGGYLPSITAFASIDRYQGWEFDGTNSSWAAGLMLEWSIFDGLFTPGTVSEKRAGYKAASEEARLARLQTSVELTSASFNVRETSERVTVMERAVALARESAELTRQRFAQGLALSANVIDAEDALIQTEWALAQSKTDKLLALAALRRAQALPILGDTQ